MVTVTGKGDNTTHIQKFYLKKSSDSMRHNLGGAFKYVVFSTLLGEMIQFD